MIRVLRAVVSTGPLMLAGAADPAGGLSAVQPGGGRPPGGLRGLHVLRLLEMQLIKRREMAMTRLPAAFLVACFLATGGEAVAAPTPVATEFNVEVTDEVSAARGFAVDLEGADYRIGMVAVCDRRTGAVTVTLFFGSFPVAQPVQAAVRTASGRIERFGAPVSTQYGAGSGFHTPVITDQADIVRFIESAFSDGAMISNGYNSFWNRIPPAANDGAKRDLLGCAAQ